MVKKIARAIISTLLVAYILTCIVINTTYEQILTKKIDADQIVFDVLRVDDSPRGDRYIVYIKDSTVGFCAIKNIDITLFFEVYMPSIQKRFVVDPNNMTTVEGTYKKYPFFSNDEKIKNGIAIEADKVFPETGLLKSSYIYFGLTDKEISDYDLKIYSIDDISKGKYIFMLENKGKVQFDDFFKRNMTVI